MDVDVNGDSPFADFSSLDVERLRDLDRILKSILTLPIARDTYAQIIDGTKTDAASGVPKPSHRVIQAYEKIRTAITPQTLRLDPHLVQNFQKTPLDSKEYVLRLLEVVTASVNALAGMLFSSFHPHTLLKPPELSADYNRQLYQTGHFYVEFYHTEYRRFEDYPFGLLNVVGYWAETEIFGGVLLFERGESGSEINNAFLHPQSKSLAFQLSERQLKCFSDLRDPDNAAQGAVADTTFPFLQEPDVRVEATWVERRERPLYIYKNEYDKPPPWYTPSFPCCVWRKRREGPQVSSAKANTVEKEEE